MGATALEMPIGEEVLSIMALASKIGGIKKFSYPSVFAAFHKLAQKYPQYFPRLYFHYLAGGSPHSRTLENILFRLGAWESISVENPRFHYLQVKKEIVADINDDIKKRYGEEALKALKGLGEEFAGLIPQEECEQ